MKFETICILLAVASAVVVFIGNENPAVNGVGKAFVGVFIIVFLISKLFREPHAT
jgi:hypothetical protein